MKKKSDRHRHRYHVNLSLDADHEVSIYRLDSGMVRHAFAQGEQLVLSRTVYTAASLADLVLQCLWAPLLLVLMVAFPLVAVLVMVLQGMLDWRTSDTLPVLLAAAYLLSVVYWFWRNQAWHDFKRRKLLARTEALVIDFDRGELAATETFAHFPGRSRRVAVPLGKVRLEVERYLARHDSDVPDADAFLLRLKPRNGGAFISMPWAELALSYPFYQVEFDGDEAAARAGIDAVVQAFTARVAV